jgi:hypothetical protein
MQLAHEVLAVELGCMARVGEGAHVNHELDPLLAKQLDEPLKRVR